MNQEIINNLEILSAAVEAQPETLFNLSSYCDDGEENVCGTLFCTAGLASTMPSFKEQGLELVKTHWDTYYVKVDGIDIDDNPKTNELFGPDAWYNLFPTYGDGSRDRELGCYFPVYSYKRAMTDKELALARLRAQIKELKEGA